MLRTRTLVTFLSTMLLMAPGRTHAQARGDGETVTVEGRGASPWEARQDAVRMALQQTMRPLVLADRAVDGDRLVRDQVLSTLNGFVERFEELSRSRESAAPGTQPEWIMKARVTVSPSAVRLFLARAEQPAATAQLDGAQMLAEVAIARERRVVNGKLFQRLLQGFPMQAYDVAIARVVPDAEAESVTVHITISMNEGFMDHIGSAMKALVVSGAARPVLSNGGRGTFGNMAGTADPGDTKGALFVMASKPVPESWKALPFFAQRCDSPNPGVSVCGNEFEEYYREVSWGVQLRPSPPRGAEKWPRWDWDNRNFDYLKLFANPSKAIPQTWIAQHDLERSLSALTSDRIVLVLRAESRAAIVNVGMGAAAWNDAPEGVHLSLVPHEAKVTLPTAFFENTKSLAVSVSDIFETMLKERTVMAPSCTQWNRVARAAPGPDPLETSTIFRGTNSAYVGQLLREVVSATRCTEAIELGGVRWMFDPALMDTSMVTRRMRGNYPVRDDGYWTLRELGVPFLASHDSRNRRPTFFLVRAPAR
jgi:hypothetical protein